MNDRPDKSIPSTSSGSTTSLIYLGTVAGGCARKVPALTTIGLVPSVGHPGEAFMNDAALNYIEGGAILQTIDVITPLVPDPADFGEIAAVNALSDIYASGGRALTALAIAAIPEGDAEAEMGLAMSAGRSRLEAEGCELVGGHSIRDREAKLGYSILGRLTYNNSLATGALVGDSLILTKPLGVGIIASAFKQGFASAEDLGEAIGVMKASNRWLADLAGQGIGRAIHAATDVSGYGLLGHARELAGRSGVGLSLINSAIPSVSKAREFADRGVRTSAAAGNASYAEPFQGLDFVSETDLALLTDPQTSGGILMAVDPTMTEDVLEALRTHRVEAASVGHVSANGLSVLV